MCSLLLPTCCVDQGGVHTHGQVRAVLLYGGYGQHGYGLVYSTAGGKLRKLAAGKIRPIPGWELHAAILRGRWAISRA
jgi:hypothetical protein